MVIGCSWGCTWDSAETSVVSTGGGAGSLFGFIFLFLGCNSTGAGFVVAVFVEADEVEDASFSIFNWKIQIMILPETFHKTFGCYLVFIFHYSMN